MNSTRNANIAQPAQHFVCPPPLLQATCIYWQSLSDQEIFEALHKGFELPTLSTNALYSFVELLQGVLNPKTLNNVTKNASPFN